MGTGCPRSSALQYDTQQPITHVMAITKKYEWEECRPFDGVLLRGVSTLYAKLRDRSGADLPALSCE